MGAHTERSIADALPRIYRPFLPEFFGSPEGMQFET